MLPLIQIGPLPLQAPGLFLILGMWLGLLLAERLAARFESTANDIYNLTFFAFLASLPYVCSFPAVTADPSAETPMPVISKTAVRKAWSILARSATARWWR